MRLPHSLIGFILLILIWWLVSVLDITNPIYFASPLEAWNEALIMFQESGFWSDIGVTLRRVAISILASIIMGVPVGMLLGYSLTTYKYASGVLDFLRSIPPIVIFPLLFIALGTGDNSRVFTAVFGGVSIALLIIAKGLASEDRTLQEFYKLKRVSLWRRIRHIIWYKALPHIMVAVRTIASLSLIIIVITEMLIGDVHGLGTRIQNVQITSNIPDLFVSIVVVGLIGFAINRFFLWGERKLIFWK